MDKIANMLITIKNGGNAGRDFVETPYSAYKQSIAKCLFDHGLIKGYDKKKRKTGDVLEIEINYKENGKPTVSDVKRISKPSRRLYASVKEIYKVRQGFGKLVLSTPKGIMTGEDARREMVGGEILFEIW